MAVQVSLKSIAEACSLSVSTVSQILNDKPNNYSSEETRRKVRETAERLGYKKNFGYQLMRGQKTRTFAILTSMLHMKTEEHIRELVINLMSELDRRGYASYFSPMGNSEKENIGKMHEFIARGVEHFIVLGTPVGYQAMERAAGDASRLMISTSVSFKRWLTVDTVKGAAEIIRFLSGKAGEKFRFLAPEQILSGQEQRARSLALCFPRLTFDEIIARYVRLLEPSPCRIEDYSDAAYHSGFLAAEKLFAEEPDVKAVCCNTDSVVLGVADYLIRSGRVIGKDVLLGGFNNDFGVRNSPFPISSVDHGWRNRSSMLIDAALTSGECRILLEPEIHIREFDRNDCRSGRNP